MSAVATPARLQSELALARANEARMGGVEIKRALAAGRMTVGQALEDSRSGSLTISQLLAAQHRWGRTRMVRFIARLGSLYQCPVSETRRVRDLTPRQRAVIVQALAG